MFGVRQILTHHINATSLRRMAGLGLNPPEVSSLTCTQALGEKGGDRLMCHVVKGDLVLLVPEEEEEGEENDLHMSKMFSLPLLP